MTALLEKRRGTCAEATFDVAHTRFVLEHLTDPTGALRQMVRASGTQAVISCSPGALPQDLERVEVDGSDGQVPRPVTLPTHLAYVLFTSGTT